MATVLVLGASGYVGRYLVPRLIEAGHRVTCLARDPDKLRGAGWHGVRIVEGDVQQPGSLDTAFKSSAMVYYLIHSMGAGEKEFERLDRLAAGHVAAAAREAGVKRIIYLGGLGRRGNVQSPHLRSRHEVGDILRSSGRPVTEFRAAVIAGAGGISFEMVHHLVNRLPFMICPRWVNIKTQPIAVDDVVRYLTESIEKPDTAGKTIDIGGPEILTYGDMMLAVAHVLGLKRYLIQVPVLTPRLSSYWLKLVTPLPVSTARALIESVRSETVCENDYAGRLFDFHPMTFAEASRRALAQVRADSPVRGDLDGVDGTTPPVDATHLRQDRRLAEVEAPARDLFAVISSIGGSGGWYFADWLWKLRGWIDGRLGGVGMRRGSRRPADIRVGDTIDFWRVEGYDPGRRLLLGAEIKVWGRAWLEFEARALAGNRSRLIQTARYYPRGLLGLLYWYVTYPIHRVVFRGLARAVTRRAESVFLARTAVADKGEMT